MIRRGRFERHRRLPRLHGGKLALLIACLIQTALSVFSFAMLGKVTGALITQSAADVWRGGSDERFAQVSAFLPVNGTIDLDSIRSFRATLENAFVQNSIFAPEPDAQDRVRTPPRASMPTPTAAAPSCPSPASRPAA